MESLKRKIVGPCCSILQSLDCLPAFTHSPRTLEKCYCSALCPSLDTLRLQCASGQLQTDPCGVCLQCAPGVSTAPARPLKILTLMENICSSVRRAVRRVREQLGRVRGRAGLPGEVQAGAGVRAQQHRGLRHRAGDAGQYSTPNNYVTRTNK